MDIGAGISGGLQTAHHMAQSLLLHDHGSVPGKILALAKIFRILSFYLLLQSNIS